MSKKILITLILGMFLLSFASADYKFQNDTGTDLVRIFSENGNVNALGNISAMNFIGSGKYLTDLPVGGDSIWSKNGNIAYYNLGRVGIGTNDPATPVEINANYGSTGLLLKSSTIGTRPGIRQEVILPPAGVAYNLVESYLGDSESSLIRSGTIGTYGIIKASPTPSESRYMYFGAESDATWDKNTFRLYPDKKAYFDGVVGIGDIVPDADLKLDVSGKIGAMGYCDQNGLNCIDMTTTNNLQKQTVVFNQDINPSVRYIEFQNPLSGAPYTNIVAKINVYLESDSVSPSGELEKVVSWYTVGSDLVKRTSEVRKAFGDISTVFNIGDPIIVGDKVRIPIYSNKATTREFLVSMELFGGRESQSGFYSSWTVLPEESAAFPGQSYVNFERPIGIGTATPSDSLKLDVEGKIGAIEYCDENGTNCIVPGLLSQVSTEEKTVSRIVNPSGATMGLSGDQTGAIEIALPNAGKGTMVKLTAEVFEYGTNEAFTVKINGLTYGLTSWARPSVQIISSKPELDHPVRFGYRADGVGVIYIGELDSVWSSLKVGITEVLASQSSYAVDSWASGWDMNLVTSFPSDIDYTVTDNLVASDFNKLQNNPFSLEGIDTIVNASLKIKPDQYVGYLGADPSDLFHRGYINFYNASNGNFEIHTTAPSSDIFLNPKNKLKLDGSFEFDIDKDGVNTRKFFSDGSRGVLLQKQGDAVTWAMSYGFNSGDGLVKGGYGAFGDSDSVDYYYIGEMYNDAGLYVRNKTVGIGDYTPDAGLKLDVEGKIGATELCDQDGNNCKLVSDLNKDVSNPVIGFFSHAAKFYLDYDGPEYYDLTLRSNHDLCTGGYYLGVMYEDGTINLVDTPFSEDCNDMSLSADGTVGSKYLVWNKEDSRLYFRNSKVLFLPGEQVVGYYFNNNRFQWLVATSPTFFPVTNTLDLGGNNIALNNGWLSGDGGNEGVFVSDIGQIGLGNSVIPANLRMVSNGRIGASQYCDMNGLNCKSIAETTHSSEIVSVPAAGWYRLATIPSNRGAGSVKIDTTGGDRAPRTLEIRWSKDWGVGSAINLISDSVGAPYVSNIRITTENSETHIEAEFTSSISSFLIESNDYGYNPAILNTGELPVGSGTVLTEAKVGELNIQNDLFVNYNGVVGIGTTEVNAGLKLDVDGKIGATEYCDQDGLNCRTISAITDGGKWNISGNNLFPKDLGLNVGIGTATPREKLEVVGNINATGDVCSGTACLSDISSGKVNANNSDYLDGYDASFFMPLNKSVYGDFDFNSGWTTGGVSIVGGDVYAQKGYFYEINSLTVSTLEINGSLLPPSGFGNTFDVGNSSNKWRNGNFAGVVNANKFVGDGSELTGLNWNVSGSNMYPKDLDSKIGIGTNNPNYKLDVQGTLGVRDAFRVLLGDDMKAIISTSSNAGVFQLMNSIGTAKISLIASGNSYFNGGNISIGTIFPSVGLKLDVEGKVGATGYCDENGANCKTISELLSSGQWDISGNSIYSKNLTKNVGIGTTTPREKLEVVGNIYSYNLKQDDTLDFVAVGRGAVISSGSTYMGINAGYGSSGNNNVGVGWRSLWSNKGSSMVSIGQNAGADNLGTLGTFVGAFAGLNNKGNSGIFIGERAGEHNKLDYNVGIGRQAGRYGNSTQSVAVGSSAGHSNNGDYSTMFGYLSGSGNTGDHLISIGQNSGQDNVGENSIFLGKYTGFQNTGDFSIGIGSEALFKNKGENVIAIGNMAGKDNTQSNKFIVKQSNVNAVPLIYGDFATGALNIAGDVTAAGYYYNSDEKLKENIETIDSPIEKISALRGVDFNWKSNGRKDIGFIAQEVETVLPELVSENTEGIKSVEYGNIVAVLVEGMKEQQKEIEELRWLLEELKNEQKN